MPGAIPECKNWVPLATPMAMANLCGHVSISCFCSSAKSSRKIELPFVFSDCPRAKYGRESDRNDYLKLFLLPLRWHLNVPFEMYSKIRKMVLHALGLSWWVMMQCPIMLTKWRCLSLEITSMCSVKLCIAWPCSSLKHLTAANEPSLILPLYSWRQKKSFQVKRMTK